MKKKFVSGSDIQKTLKEEKMKYNPYSKNLKCKWCGREIMDHFTDCQCDPCWEVLSRLSWVFSNPRLFKEVKRLIEKHDDEVRIKENA